MSIAFALYTVDPLAVAGEKDDEIRVLVCSISLFPSEDRKTPWSVTNDLRDGGNEVDEADFRDDTKSSVLDRRYSGIVETQGKFIAPCAEPV